MKKIVFTFMMVLAVGGLTTLQAAEIENTRAMRSEVAVEQVTNRMTRQLALSERQRMEVQELNRKYHYLFEGSAPMSLSDREYRKAWDKYDSKLRKILSAHQYTLYLSSRGALYASSPRPSVRVTVPRPQPVPRVTVPQGRNRQPMATTPRGNNRPQAGNGRTQGSRPQAGNGRTQDNRPQVGDGRTQGNRPQAGNGRPDNWRSRSNPQQKGETPEEPKAPTNEQDPI